MGCALLLRWRSHYCLSSLIHFTIGNIDKNDLYDAPANRDNVKDIFEEATNVLEIGIINHNDKTRHANMYNTKHLDHIPGDALPPKACHIRGEGVDLLGGQVLLSG